MGAHVSWRVSAAYATGLTSSLERLGYLELVKARLSAPALSLIQEPNREAWWPGAHLLDCFEALLGVEGPGLVRRVSIDLSRERMSPLVRPLASVVLLFTRSPPLAIFSRMQTFLSAGVHGIGATFVPFRQQGGTLSFRFPEPVPEVMAEAWYGVLDVAFTLARAGEVVEQRLEPTAHHFVLRW